MFQAVFEQTILFLMRFIALPTNRNISLKNLGIFPIVKDGNISPGRKYYIKIYIHINVWKFCGDHILIKFFFGCIIDVQKNPKRSDEKLLH